MSTFFLVLLVAVLMSAALAYLMTYLLVFMAWVMRKKKRSAQPAKPWTDELSGLKDLLQALYDGKVQGSQALKKFAELLPRHLENIAVEQGRSISDVLIDVTQLSEVNVSGVQELAREQVKFPGLTEVWVFARRPVDLEKNFYSTVCSNIVERFIQYYYFQSDYQFFTELRDRLKKDIGNKIDVDKYIHCILLPSLFFLVPGFGLLITEDIRHIKGKTVTRIAEDGTIIQAQDMSPSQIREAYLNLRPFVEQQYERILPVLEGERPQEPGLYQQISNYSTKIQ